MEKKEYMKPNMVVVKLNHKTCLLAGSEWDNGGEGGYIPRMDEDMNKLA